MELKPTDLVILALATWRLAYMLASGKESGPFRIIDRFRAFTTLGGMLECVFCTSVWAALGLYALWQLIQWPVIVLAVSGAALIVDRYVVN